MLANLGDATVDGVEAPEGELIFETAPSVAADLKAGRIGAWAVACHVTQARLRRPEETGQGIKGELIA